jgi:hypothetical protein
VRVDDDCSSENDPSRARPVIGSSGSNNVHLLSLEWTEGPGVAFSKTVQDVWRWKDAVLGDGRDFFVPKPKTIGALQAHLLEQRDIDECVVLSNCARFELLLVTSTSDPTSGISSKLLSQVDSHLSQPFLLHVPFDFPGQIDPRAKKVKDATRVMELSSRWTRFTGTKAVAEHLSLVAAGMAPRPNRPGRAVHFAPFSSRDAHILLQLKRTLKCCDGTTSQTLLRYALQAGKAARDTNKVPELAELRQYGTGNSKYDTTPPKDISRRVAEVRAFGKGAVLG